MRKHTLLATVAALSLLGATGIASAQGQMQAPKTESAPAAKEPAAREPASKPAQAQTNAPKQAQDKPADNKAAEKPASSGDSKAAQKPADDKKDSAQKPADDKKDSAQKPADNKGDTKASTTGSAGGAAKAAAPPAEKRTQIATAFKQEKIKSVTNVNFNISIGTRVPRTVEFYPIPTRIIEIYPEWRGYRVILVSGRYIIVEPETYEIVYILEV